VLAADTPQERRRFLLALGEFREPALITRTLDATLGDRVPTQDVAMLLMKLLGNRAARERTWSFVKRRFSALRKRMPPMLASRVVEALPALQTPAYRRDVAAFFRAHPLPTATRALKQTLERFDLNTALRRRSAPELRRWLAAME
jgi:puromycin-sensitive aminopeptidase